MACSMQREAYPGVEYSTELIRDEGRIIALFLKTNSIELVHTSSLFTNYNNLII